jgi:hypothetical protein
MCLQIKNQYLTSLRQLQTLNDANEKNDLILNSSAQNDLWRELSIILTSFLQDVLVNYTYKRHDSANISVLSGACNEGGT